MWTRNCLFFSGFLRCFLGRRNWVSGRTFCKFSIFKWVLIDPLQTYRMYVRVLAFFALLFFSHYYYCRCECVRVCLYVCEELIRGDKVFRESQRVLTTSKH
ncbi:unnamed protein product, partial [Choristocarpus tenellus]